MTRAEDPFDVVAPHNSFVNLLYRTGLVGFLGLLAILAVAAIRVWRALHASGASQFDRAVLAVPRAALFFSAMIASFNVALEAPFLALISGFTSRSSWFCRACLVHSRRIAHKSEAALAGVSTGQRSSGPAV